MKMWLFIPWLATSLVLLLGALIQFTRILNAVLTFDLTQLATLTISAIVMGLIGLALALTLIERL